MIWKSLPLFSCGGTTTAATPVMFMGGGSGGLNSSHGLTFAESDGSLSTTRVDWPAMPYSARDKPACTFMTLAITGRGSVGLNSTCSLETTALASTTIQLCGRIWSRLASRNTTELLAATGSAGGGGVGVNSSAAYISLQSHSSVSITFKSFNRVGFLGALAPKREAVTRSA